MNDVQPRISDAHGHFFSHQFFQTLARGMSPAPAEQDLYGELGRYLPFEFPPTDPAGLAERWVEELDRHRVDSMVVMASVPGDEASVDIAGKVSGGRLVPFFMVDPTAADAPGRVERAFEDMSLKAMALFPAMHHFHLWDERLTPLIDCARRSGAAVFVHCGVLKLGIRDKLGLESPFDLRFANPVDLNGIARAFPDVPFIVPHFGGGFFRELLMTASECPNIFTDTSSSNAWMLLQAAPMSLVDVFRRAIDVMGVERLLYGSDSSFFPRGWQRSHFEAQAELLGTIGLSVDERAAILGGNLRRILGI